VEERVHALLAATREKSRLARRGTTKFTGFRACFLGSRSSRTADPEAPFLLRALRSGSQRRPARLPAQADRAAHTDRVPLVADTAGKRSSLAARVIPSTGGHRVPFPGRLPGPGRFSSTLPRCVHSSAAPHPWALGLDLPGTGSGFVWETAGGGPPPFTRGSSPQPTASISEADRHRAVTGPRCIQCEKEGREKEEKKRVEEGESPAAVWLVNTVFAT